MSDYENLMEAIPKMAEAVARFQDPAIQRKAFDALLIAWCSDHEADPDVVARLQAVRP